MRSNVNKGAKFDEKLALWGVKSGWYSTPVAHGLASFLVWAKKKPPHRQVQGFIKLLAETEGFEPLQEVIGWEVGGDKGHPSLASTGPPAPDIP